MSSENRKTILLVEDEALIALSEKMSLEKYGYNVLTANSGEKAVSMLQAQNNIQLILMDIDLGKGIDGTEAADRILKKHDIPIVFLSSHTEPEIVEKTERITSYGYVVKNSSITVLDASIKMAFKLFDAKVNESKKEKMQRESEKRYRGMMTNIEAGFVVHAPDTSIIMCNPRASELLGLDEEQMKGKKSIDPQWQFIHENHIPFTLEEYPVHKILNSKSQIKMYLTGVVRPATDDIVWLLVNGFPVQDDEGSVSEILISFIDITELKRSEEALRASKESLSITLQSIGDAVIATDIKGSITRMNKTAEQLTGWCFDDAKNQPLQKVFNIINADTRLSVENPVNKALEFGGIVGLANHTILLSRNGNEYQISDSAAPIKDQFGNIQGVILVFSDVTEKYNTEKLLRESESRYQLVFENSGTANSIFDTDCRLIMQNKLSMENLGCPDNQALGKSVYEVFGPEVGAAVEMRMKRVIETRIPETFETEFNLVTGMKWFRSTYQPLLDKNNYVHGVQIISQDISEQKSSEQSLKESEEKYRTYIDNSPVGIFVADSSGKYLDVNPAACAMLGYTCQELLSLSIKDLNVESSDDSNPQSFQKLKIEGQVTAQRYLKKKDGSKVIVNLHAAKLPDGNFIAFCTDISERKQAEEALHKSEERLQLVLKGANDAAWDWNLENNELFYSPNWWAMLGFGTNELPANHDTWQQLMHPDDKLLADKIMGHALSNGLDKFSVEFRLQHKDGHYIPFLSRGFILRDEKGKPVRISGANTDLTELKRIEFALKESEENYRLLHENSGIAIGYYKTDGTVISYNQRAAENLNGLPKDFNGKSIFDIFPKEDAEFYLQRIKNACLSDRPVVYEDFVSLPSGNKYFISTFKRIVDSYNKLLGVQIISQDITERKLAEEQINKLLAEKELILKEVHHRIKNNMNTIKGFLTLQAEASNEPLLIEALKDAESRIQSMTVLYDKIYRSDNFTEISMKEYLTSIVDEIINIFPKKSAIITEKQIEDSMISVEKVLPVGIIINELLTNIMKYAFSGRTDGKITVTAIKTETQMVIALQDNGIGLPEEVDFNTSSGFGMQLVVLMAEQIDGTINIKRGNGTNFILEFPL